MSNVVAFLWACVVLCFQVTLGQVSVVPLLEGRMQSITNGFTFIGSVTLIRDGATTIVVDTPSGTDVAGTNTMLSGLTQNSLTPSQIQALVITHGHPDHFGHDSLFTNARQYFNTFSHMGTSFSQLTYQNGVYQLSTNVQLIQTPGHTTQDVSVIVKNVPSRGTVAVVGDLIYDSVDALNAATAQVGQANSVPTLLTSRTKVICMADYIVPGHGVMFQVTAAMRTAAQCTGGGGGVLPGCSTNLNQIVVNGQCYNLMMPNMVGCVISEQCVGGSTCVNGACACPTASVAVNNICKTAQGNPVSPCPALQVLAGAQCVDLTVNQPCVNVICLSGGSAQCKASFVPYSNCKYHSILNNYYCCL